MPQGLLHAPGVFGDNQSIAEDVQKTIFSLSKERQGRIAGIGLGVPSTSEAQSHEGLHRYLEAAFQLPVFVQNDITAAAGGESLFGAARRLPDFLFFYLGAKLHNRLILNHQIYNGNSHLSFDVGVQDLEGNSR